MITTFLVKMVKKMTEKRKCRSCGIDLPTKGAGWHNRRWCEKPSCAEAKLDYERAVSRARMRAHRKTLESSIYIFAKGESGPPLNGRKCIYPGCGKPLRGNYHRWCPEHHKRVSRYAGRIDGNHIFFDYDTEMDECKNP